jgi:carboxyl-terminal processing protease
MKFAQRKAIAALVSTALLLSGCGGSGGGGSSASGGGTGGSPTPTPAGNATCTLRARQDWAAAQLREWYLFPDTLPASLDPTPYGSVADYVDALTASARSQGKDRYFTYVTSIAEEDDYYRTGATAGFGIRLKVDEAARRAYVSEAFEGAPGLAAGLDRGTEILAVGTSEGSLRSTSDIIAASGEGGFIDALGPSTPGTSRAMRIRDANGERVVTATKADYDLTPVSSRYGARVLDDGGRKVGYINLRTFITSANTALRQAFADFRAQGVTDIIVDLRYNGGGLLSVADTLGNLLGGNRRTNEVFTQISYRPEKSSDNEISYFSPQAESISPRRIAFIGFEGSASASELVINAMVPYLHADVALIGSNTYGKPVGQIALDRSACDDRLRVVAFATRNAAGRGDYYDGLAPAMEKTCAASDDIAYPLGDAREASISVALDYLAGRSCTPIGGATAGIRAQSVAAPAARLLVPDRPTTPEREVPGLF